MFSPTTYQKRRAALRDLLAAQGLSEGSILVLGAEEVPRNYTDNTHPFRQDSTFLYLFGLAEAGLAGSIDLDSGRATLYGEDRSLDAEIWSGPLPSLAELGASIGVEETRPRASLGKDLSGRKAGRGLHFVRPYRADQRQELAALAGIRPEETDAAASIELMRGLIALRDIKSPEEIAELDAAAEASAELHRTVIRAARPGLREYELGALAAASAFRSGGALAFPVIATTRGDVLHNHRYDRVLEEGGLFLLDSGVETARGYAGDLTSTFPIGRRFDGRQRAIYEIVLAGFSAATGLLRPGVSFKEVHLASARAMAEGLAGLGLLRGNLDEAVAAGAHALFFPHGLGHLIGLDVHDMENYGEVLVGHEGKPKSEQFGLRSLRLGKALKAGMVHSVEPGIYFIEGLIRSWKAEGRHAAFIDYAEAERWIGFGGVRNEEDWLVTETGARKLGGPFDKSIAAIEALRA